MTKAVFLLAFLSFFLNLPLGKWRSRYRKFTLPWWLLIHASIPVLIPLRYYLQTPIYTIPLFILLAVLAQYLGAKGRIEKIGE